MELGGCRFSPTAQYLSPEVFQSFACAHCLFYIYFVTPPYSKNYETIFCDGRGLLICPHTSMMDKTTTSIGADLDDHDGSESYEKLTHRVLKESDAKSLNLSDAAKQFRRFRRNCTCEGSPENIYNHPKFALNASTNSIENLSLTPSLPVDFVPIVQHCCEAAARCCTNVLLPDSKKSNYFENNLRQRSTSQHFSSSNDANSTNSKQIYTEYSLTCPATWDGWHCFERAEPGDLSAGCPNYIFGDRIRNDIDGLVAVRKTCLASGKWYTVSRQASGVAAEWTDYSGCVSDKAYTLKLFAGLFAFGVTVVTIVPAIFIFSLHRSLRNQPMFVIHRHLLYSFLFSGIFYIFNCLFFAIDGAPGDHLYFMNHLSCRLLFTVQLRYFRLSTFSWMLGEGVYLYRLLMCTFSSGIEPLRPYFITCWGNTLRALLGLPLVITSMYSFLRETYDNEECWIMPTKIWLIEWTIIGPCLAALSINFLLMLVIFCVLLKKLRCNSNLEPTQYTKAVRAVFMLVPVFGLHFFITIYRIQSYVHQIVNLVLDGLQGFVVVLIVCYTNRTVIESVRTWIQNRREENSLRRQSEDHKMRFKRSTQERNIGERHS